MKNLNSGYDSLGRQYDSLGTKRNWWSNFSLENFEEKCSCFVEQYSHIPINGTYFDGQYTLIENIADNAGIQCKHEIVQKCS
jgi:predicted metalloendopeptidase